MSTHRTLSTSARTMLILAALFGVAGLVALGLPDWQGTTPAVTGNSQGPATPASAPAPAPPGAPALAPALAAGPAAPSFDIVRVGPGGGAVIAGRAEPGAAVTVLSGGRSLGVAQADASGTWTLIPGVPLPEGAAELTLSAQTPGGTAVAGNQPVLLVVPRASGGPSLAVLARPDGSSRVLQGPSSSTPGKLGLDTVDYDEQGAIRFSGTAPAGSAVRVYVDGAPIGDAGADASGHWGLAPAQPVSPGLHRLRLDQVGSNGRVANRLELPFLRETLAQSEIPPGSVVVQPQQNLWRLARRAYGSGIRYTLIYQANREQIRDPRRIYVGQVFAIPAANP